MPPRCAILKLSCVSVKHSVECDSLNMSLRKILIERLLSRLILSLGVKRLVARKHSPVLLRSILLQDLVAEGGIETQREDKGQLLLQWLKREYENRSIFRGDEHHGVLSLIVRIVGFDSLLILHE